MMTNLGPHRAGGMPWGWIAIIVVVVGLAVAFAYWRGFIGGGLVEQTSTPAGRSAVAPAPAVNIAKVATPPATVPTPAPSSSPAPRLTTPQSTTPAEVASQVSAAVALIPRDPVAARRALTKAIDTNALAGATLASALEGIELANSQLLFAPVAVSNDPLQTTYTIKPGDSLAKIAKAAGMKADWRLLQRLNNIKDPGKISVGQKLKVPLGTFHAVVHRDAFRMDVYQDNGTDRVIVGSFPVGLGERNGTPLGVFKVRAGSTLINPEWRNPRTGEYFSAGDPKNPIGEYWIGLAGADESTKNFLGYGIHGTVEPGSIGQNASMGCVRMHSDDVALVYELLTEDGSRIDIRPQ